MRYSEYDKNENDIKKYKINYNIKFSEEYFPVDECGKIVSCKTDHNKNTVKYTLKINENKKLKKRHSYINRFYNFEDEGFEAISKDGIYHKGSWYFDGWYYDKNYRVKVNDSSIIQNEIEMNDRKRTCLENIKLVKAFGNAISEASYEYTYRNPCSINIYGRWIFNPKYEIIYSIYSKNGELPERVDKFADNVHYCDLDDFNLYKIEYESKYDKKDIYEGREKMFFHRDKLYEVGDSIKNILTSDKLVNEFEAMFMNSTYKYNNCGDCIFLKNGDEYKLDKEKLGFIEKFKYGKNIRQHGTWEITEEWKPYKIKNNNVDELDKESLKVFSVTFINKNGKRERRKYKFFVLNKVLMFNEYLTVKYNIELDSKCGSPVNTNDLNIGDRSVYEEKNIKTLNDLKSYNIKKPLKTEDNYGVCDNIRIIGKWTFDGWKKNHKYMSGRTKISKYDLTLEKGNESGTFYQWKYILNGKWTFEPEYQVSYFLYPDVEYDVPDFGIDFSAKESDRGYKIGEELRIKDINIFREILKNKSVVIQKDGKMCIGKWEMDGWYHGDPKDEEVIWNHIEMQFNNIDRRFKPEIMDEKLLREYTINGIKYYRLPVFANLRFYPKKFYGMKSRALDLDIVKTVSKEDNKSHVNQNKNERNEDVESNSSENLLSEEIYNNSNINNKEKEYKNINKIEFQIVYVKEKVFRYFNILE